ncbi:MAG: iron ABC transporter permease [Thalassobaculales bacterium]
MTALALPAARRPLVTLALPAVLAVLAAAMLSGLAIGAVPIAPARVVAILAEALGFGDSGASARERLVLIEVRLPRVLVGALVGAGLAVAGAALQGLFRNPLADSDLIGVSSGAAVTTALAILAGPLPFLVWLGPQAVPLAAFAGGLAVLGLVWRVAGGGPDRVATMLLAGVGIGALARAALGFASFVSTDQQLRDITFWLLGSLGGAGWGRLWAMAPLLLPAVWLLLRQARALDALALGYREAGHLGVDVNRLARIVTWTAALIVGAAVAVSGVIGFVGLITPHLVRLMVGPAHGRLMLLSAVLGAALLVAADTAARTIVTPAELPVGILTAVMGVPVFIALLIRRRRAQEAS